MKTEELIKLENLADNPYQPRSTDDPEHIEKLARSIAADGLLPAPEPASKPPRRRRIHLSVAGAEAD